MYVVRYLSKETSVLLVVSENYQTLLDQSSICRELNSAIVYMSSMLNQKTHHFIPIVNGAPVLILVNIKVTYDSTRELTSWNHYICV